MFIEASSLDAQTGQPATDHLRAALPIVHAFHELTQVAREKNKKCFYEATVMDGVAIFSMFPMGLPATDLRGFAGVLNSTSNVVLTEIEQGRSFDDASKRAQAMDAPVKREQVQRTGIRGLSEEKPVREAGMRYKLVCRPEQRGDTADCRVQPELLLASDPLANLDGTSSAIRFDLDVFGLSMVEHNPGIEATGYGLLVDFLRAVQP